MSEVVERLFCVLATLGVVPIIRCPRGGAAEHVAAQVGEGGGWGPGGCLSNCGFQARLRLEVSLPSASHTLPDSVPIQLDAKLRKKHPSWPRLPVGTFADLSRPAFFLFSPQLDAKLRDALAGRTSLFAEGGAGSGLAASLQRPLLCLFDRNFELSVVLQHAWTYKPLVGGR